jgi:predicted AlkP superfamily pyrophosphatase or phosphodiesterase
MKVALNHWRTITLAGLFFLFSIPASRAADPPNNSNRVVVMVSVDGLAGFYFDDPKVEMPNIRALATAGSRSSQMKCSTPTVTWPIHTTLVTGANPARHGVVANYYWDRSARKRVRLLADPIHDKEQIVLVPTIYDLAKDKGFKTAAIRWPATRNASTLDWTIPDMAPGKPTLTFSTPGLKDDCQRAGIPFGSTNQNANTNLALEVIYTRIFNMILREKRPNLGLLHLVDVDYIQHSKGPRTPEAYAAIKDADDRVGEIWAQLKRDYPERSTLFVVSDHGFSPIRRTLLPNVILRKEGLVISTTNGPVQIVSQGGAAMVYVLDNDRRKEMLSQIRKALRSLQGISKMIGVEDFNDYGVANPKDDPNAPDLILFAEEGCVFGETADGDVPFIEKPQQGGNHGHDANAPFMKGIFVAWGAGIKSGVNLKEISNLSVAPTIAELLGFSMPKAEGKPLKAALTRN